MTQTDRDQQDLRQLVLFTLERSTGDNAARLQSFLDAHPEPITAGMLGSAALLALVGAHEAAWTRSFEPVVESRPASPIVFSHDQQAVAGIKVPYDPRRIDRSAIENAVFNHVRQKALEIPKLLPEQESQRDPEGGPAFTHNDARVQADWHKTPHQRKLEARRPQDA
jgi:hypothetical protein